MTERSAGDGKGVEGAEAPGGTEGHAGRAAPPDELHQRLVAYVGRPATVGGEGRDPVNEPMIRHWCEAMGDTGAAYPAVAPPAMLQAWTMAGLSGHQGRSTVFDELFALLDDAGFTSIVATDCEQEYLRPLRPGDRIGYDSVIEAVSPRKTTKLGTGHFITTRMEIRAGGELAGTHRFRVLKYAPARKPPVRKPPPARRPRPVINADNQGFWDGVARRELLVQRCTGCGALRFPWLPGCNGCGSLKWDTVAAAGAGSVYSYVVMHHPPFPAFSAQPAGATGTADGGATGGAGPYAVALVELAEGVRMISNITGVPYDEVRVGMPVELEFLEADEELTLPVFRAVGHGRGAR
ncbi:Zn-ribbon domain-containing OB-fold protein [Streptomyces sp. NPDC001922]|uniref:Zn-ribbon domain-containing OB-fold protein n=1 Tax=Streptomyces sp. NPDC001922 TaxID=3364624 RepID=UPI0036CAF159